MSAAEEQEPAVLEFLSTFSTVSTPPESFDDLQDGVALFEALSEISPEYFDPTTIARHLGENWALKSSNLRKLVRNLEQYWRSQGKAVVAGDDGGGSGSGILDNESLMSIAKGGSGNADGLLNLVELVAAAAVTCPKKSEYVGRIMVMSPESQSVMKVVLQRSLARLVDAESYDDDGINDNSNADDDEEEDENELVFGGTSSSLGAGASKGGDGRDSSLFPEEQVSILRQEIALLKSQHAMEKEDMARASEKLQGVVEDLQDRLLKRQEELIAVEEELSAAQSSLEGVKSQLSQALQDKSQLADDLEIAQAKAVQLVKTEATLNAYKKKLESQGMMNQATRDLEDQAAQYIKQIVELEAQVKKASSLSKTVSELQDATTKLEREKADLQAASGALAGQVEDLQAKVKEAEKAKKAYADEVAELRAQVEVEASFAPKVAAGAEPPGQQSLDPELARRLQQLEAENKQLREMSVQAAVARDDSDAGKAANAALQAEITRLQEELAQKSRECAKISDDKNKLENYTKRTLAKFQDKYLVALQECKTKLKEKQDKIEALESRSASERTAQKREERLLSSTIYELGLAIMQNRLKER
jgi:protein HOOK3